MSGTEILPNINISKYLDRDERLKLGHKNINISKPVEIGSFSLDSNRKFSNDRSQLSYLENDSNLHLHEMDLSDGYHDRFIKRDDNIKERLNNLLRWIICNLHKFRKCEDETDDSSLRFPNFILWRGHVTKIMCTPYERQDGWEMAAQRFGRTIYISEVETAEAEKQRLNQSEKQKMMTYWGVRYEKYMTRSDSSLVQPSAKRLRLAPVDQKSVVVNTNEAFCSVMKVKLNSFNIIHSAEVDCCIPVDNELEPPDNYVELKTSREFTARHQEHNFYRHKTKKWWAQSYLAGVPRITCGFRNDSGTVVRIHNFRTLDLPRMARNVPGESWDANLCLSFLEYFFSEVTKTFDELGESSIVIFSWKPGDDKISYKTYDSKSDHNFLPEWYTSSLKCMKYAT